MHVRDLDTKEAPNKYKAALDAQYRDRKNSSKFSAEAKAAAVRLRTQLDAVYNYTAVYTNFRDKRIVVKLADARVRDYAALSKFEFEWAGAGITKAITAQGIIYKFPAAFS